MCKFASRLKYKICIMTPHFTTVEWISPQSPFGCSGQYPGGESSALSWPSYQTETGQSPASSWCWKWKINTNCRTSGYLCTTHGQFNIIIIIMNMMIIITITIITNTMITTTTTTIIIHPSSPPPLPLSLLVPLWSVLSLSWLWLWLWLHDYDDDLIMMTTAMMITIITIINSCIL